MVKLLEDTKLERKQFNPGDKIHTNVIELTKDISDLANEKTKVIEDISDSDKITIHFNALIVSISAVCATLCKGLSSEEVDDYLKNVSEAISETTKRLHGRDEGGLAA